MNISGDNTIIKNISWSEFENRMNCEFGKKFSRKGRKIQVTYGEAFYATDIIIVSFSEKMIWVLFHEGICWLSKREL